MHMANAFTGCQYEARISAGTSSKPARYSKSHISILERLEFDYFYRIIELFGLGWTLKMI